MNMKLTGQERDEAIHSLKKYLSSELDVELRDLQAGALLDYILKEFGPLSFNHGVATAEAYFRARLEELPDTCYEQPLTHWQSKGKR